MGVHRDRLAASRAQGRFIEGVKTALQKMGRNVPDPSRISPTIVGAKPLSLAAPSVMEEALGYRGRLRFVAFGYGPRTRWFGHCDGGDDIPTPANSGAWVQFLNHPFVAAHISKSKYPALWGEFGRKTVPSLDRIMKGKANRSKTGEHIHDLLLDRESRQLYVCQRDQLILFFSLVEAGENSAPRVFIDDLRMSPGDENYKIPPAPEIVSRLFAFLDDRIATPTTTCSTHSPRN
jgi:hypothetical protein